MKIKQILFAALCSIAILSSCKKDKTTEPPVDYTDELLGVQADKILHYSFNGSLDDESGNNLMATYPNNVTYTADRFGRPDHAIVFGGSSNMTTLATPSPKPFITGMPFSISIWFKATAVSTSQTLVKADGGEYNTYSGYWLQLGAVAPGAMSFSIGNNSANNSTARNTITTPAVFTAGNWYHVVVNVRGANDMDFYINGVKNTSCSYDGSATAMVFCSQQNQQLGVMGVFMGVGSIFEGVMDDYRIYKKALSQEEVSALYNFHPQQ